MATALAVQDWIATVLAMQRVVGPHAPVTTDGELEQLPQESAQV